MKLALSISAVLSLLLTRTAYAEAVTDWNQFAVEATKGFDGAGGAGVALDSNLATRIDAIEARGVFDAVNSIDGFARGGYSYSAHDAGSVAAAVAQAARALADARIAAFTSKYQLLSWRPITAINADADGRVTNGYAAWHPLAATPAHPSSTSGHSTTAAAGFEVLRAFFGADSILPGGGPVTLGTLPWLTGTNNGTGKVTTRSVSSFTQAQLEAGASRIYLGVHFGSDNVQGQLLGVAVADAILGLTGDPAAASVVRRPSIAVRSLLEQAKAALSAGLPGFFGQDGG